MFQSNYIVTLKSPDNGEEVEEKAQQESTRFSPIRHESNEQVLSPLAQIMHSDNHFVSPL